MDNLWFCVRGSVNSKSVLLFQGNYGLISRILFRIFIAPVNIFFCFVPLKIENFEFQIYFKLFTKDYLAKVQAYFRGRYISPSRKCNACKQVVNLDQAKSTCTYHRGPSKRYALEWSFYNLTDWLQLDEFLRRSGRRMALHWVLCLHVLRQNYRYAFTNHRVILF